jgi:putative transposase
MLDPMSRPPVLRRFRLVLDTFRFLLSPSGLEELTYPFHAATFTVTQCGRICFKGLKVNLSHVFAGQNVGMTQVAEQIWLVTFMRYDLGYFDDETCRLEPLENPFDPKVLPMRSE